VPHPATPSADLAAAPRNTVLRATASSLRGRLGERWALLRALARRPHVRGVFGLLLGIFLLQGGIGVQQFHQFQLGGYDLVIFDQGIRNYAHGNLPVSVFKDVQDAAQVSPGYPHPFSILGDHFSPILVLLAPLYWVWNNPQVLVLAEAALFALAVPSVWVFTRRALLRVAPPRPAVIAAYLVAAAFGLGWALQEASAVGFHEVAFFVPISAMMLERFQAGRLKHMIWLAVALLLVKEDAGYVVSAFGLLLLLTKQVGGVRLDPRTRRRYRIAGAGLAVGGITVAMLILHVWIPAFGGRSNFYWYYGQLGPDMAGAVKTLITDPGYALQVATQPWEKMHTLYFLFWPFLFLSLASPMCLLAVPLLAERLFSNKPEHWGLDQQYNAFLASILVLAAVDGYGRFWRRVLWPALRAAQRRHLAERLRLRRWARPRWPGRAKKAAPDASSETSAPQAPAQPLSQAQLGGRLAVGWAALVLASACVIVHTFPMWGVFDYDQWQATPLTTAQNAAVALIPNGACVEADNDIAPHLSARTQVLMLDEVPRGCPWVVLQTVNPSYPLNSATLESERADWLAANGYQLVFSQAGVSVYYHP
jgi:uncharacterized membrane protein